MSAIQVALVIVAVLALVAVAVLAVAVGKRNAQRKRDEAEQLRSDAARQSPAVMESLRLAEESGARARMARLAAERAEQEAAEAREAALAQQARHRQILREADLLDPNYDRPVELEDEASYGLQRPGKHSAA